MTKMENQETNKTMAFTESKSLREETINKTDCDFLDKIKAIPYLTDEMVLSVEQVANYFDSTNKTIHTIISRNQEEFLDEVKVIKGQELKDFKKKVCLLQSEDNIISSKVPSLTLISKRALLRIGMIMTNNALATRIRNYLLNIEEDTKLDRKQWAIQREVSIIERKRMATALYKNLPDSTNKRFAYPNYTNMLYKILFNKDAKSLRVDRNVKDNDALRDSFSEVELKLVEEGETIITALVSLGFTYEQTKEHLQQKYIKQIQG